MTPEEINKAIAGACGFNLSEIGKQIHICSQCGEVDANHSYGHQTYILVKRLPNYFNDLNACALMERTLSEAEKAVYAESLCAMTSGKVVDWGYYPGEAEIDWHSVSELLFLTAPQRCEAFLRTKGLWVESAAPLPSENNENFND